MSAWLLHGPSAVAQPSTTTPLLPLRCRARPRRSKGTLRQSAEGRPWVDFPFVTPQGNDRYLRTAAGRSRRIADVADHGLGRLNWADSGPSFLASETSADGQPHGHDGRGARGPTKGLAAGADGLRQEGRPRRGGSLRHVEMVDPHPSSKSSAAEEEGLHAHADRRWRELRAAARRRFEQHPPDCARQKIVERHNPRRRRLYHAVAKI